MRWLRLLASVPVTLIGLFITMLGLWGSVWLWVNSYSEHWAVAIVLALAWAGQTVGGLVLLYLGLRTFKRSVRRPAAA
jgi:hypothetical protein